MLGIFDSGIGGLSVLKVLKTKAPQTDVIYFGDIKNAPYGNKNQKELKKLTIKSVEILLKNGATNILSACNSISTFMIHDRLQKLSKKPFGIMEMIKPTVEKFQHTPGEILIFATPATIESQTYQKYFETKGKKIQTVAIPELAGAIEFGENKNKIENLINDAVLKSLNYNYDTVLLCCTHYPFYKKKFEQSFAKNKKNVLVCDPAEAVAQKTIEKFNLLGKDFNKNKGFIKFIISQDSPTFHKMVKKNFSDFPYTIETANED